MHRIPSRFQRKLRPPSDRAFSYGARRDDNVVRPREFARAAQPPGKRTAILFCQRTERASEPSRGITAGDAGSRFAISERGFASEGSTGPDNHGTDGNFDGQLGTMSVVCLSKTSLFNTFTESYGVAPKVEMACLALLWSKRSIEKGDGCILI